MQRRSLLLAALLSVALIIWIGSGYLFSDAATTAGTAQGTDQSPAGDETRMTVQVQEMAARPVTRTLNNQGQTEANRIVVVRGETSGIIESVLVTKGERVETGDALVRLRMDDRDVKLSEARAAVAQTEADYTAARDLAEEGFQSGNAVRQAAAALERARAELKAVELDRERTVIRAPFDGILNDRMVEIGDYVAANTAIAEVVDNDPLVATVNVAQQEIGDITLGQSAQVHLLTGEQREGTVRYLASTSDAGTRTFRVEVEIPNSDHSLLAGLSAEVSIPLGAAQAHLVSPALLALDESNQLVVKTVDAAGLVELHAVEVIRNEQQGVWVTGLPELARVITAGQGFVTRGQAVQVIDEFPISSRSDD